MRVPSGSSDRYAYFVAKNEDNERLTGLSSWTVVRSRNGAADVTYTTPTVTEIDSSTMPGVYALLIDEDTTITSGKDEEEYCFHVTHAGMEPITRVVELFRPKATEGDTISTTGGAVNTVNGLANNSITANATDATFIAEIIANIWDETNGIETGVTQRQSVRALCAVIAGLIADAGSGTETFKGIGQSSGGTTRVTGTVDSSGNRSVVTLNL